MGDINDVLGKLDNAEKQQAENERLYIEKQQEMYKDFFHDNIPEILRLRKVNLALERSLDNIKGELLDASRQHAANKAAASRIIPYPVAIIFLFIYFKLGIYSWIQDYFGDQRLVGVYVGLFSMLPLVVISISVCRLLNLIIFKLYNWNQGKIFKKYNITRKEYKQIFKTMHENHALIISLLPNWLVDFVKEEKRYYKIRGNGRYGELAVELFEQYGDNIIRWKRHVENMRDKFKESEIKKYQRKAAAESALDLSKLTMEYQAYQK